MDASVSWKACLHTESELVQLKLGKNEVKMVQPPMHSYIDLKFVVSV